MVYLHSHHQKQYVLKIIATDYGLPPLTSPESTVVIINVTNANDNPPIFLPETGLVSINEGLYADKAIFTAVAGDIDDNKIIYSLANNVTSVYINVNGTVYISGYFNYTFASSVIIIIKATDGLYNNIFVLSLFINDINEPPVASQNRYVVQIVESLPVGSYLLKLNVVDHDKGNNGQIDFQFYNNSADNNIVRLDSKNGFLWLKSAVDYEIKQAYNIQVTVHDNGEPNLYMHSRIYINITITNVNEHTPNFENSTYNFILKENDPFSAKVKAHDQDKDDQIRYFIPDKSVKPFFTIDQLTGFIKNISTIDYEVIKRFEFIVTAKDNSGTTDSRYGYTTVKLTITDTNDNVPYFKQHTHSLNVSETLAINSIILKVEAYDADSTSNGKLRFYIERYDETSQYFSIEENTGIIKLRGKLDFESLRKTHVIKVNVSDNGKPQLWSNNLTYIYVNVLNVNDNKPLFNSTHMIVYVKETNATVQIAKMTATDKDLSIMKYSIVSRYLDGHKFEIAADTGVITNKVPLDYEQYHLYQFLVKVSESINSTSSSTTTVQVNLVDVNDNKPVLSETQYSVVLPMDSVFVTRISASDRDSGENGQLKYKVTKPNIFKIDNNGYIKVKDMSLLNTVNSEYITVTVSDNGSPVKSATADVFINIIGRQEPVFLNSSYEVTINETLPVGSEVLKLNASIPNGHGAVEYILTDIIEAQYFEISMYGGIIHTKMKFNYDISQKHKFVIILRNSLDLKKISIVTIIVNIIDFNDHDPVFTSKSKVIFIEESTGIDRLVATVKAIDADKGTNADLKYSIVGGNVNYAFKVNAIGEVRVNNTLNSATTSFYSLSLRAEDGGVPKRYSENITFRITVEAPVVAEKVKPIIKIPVTKQFEKEYTSYDVELQADNINMDIDYGYYTTLPRASWYDVNYRANINKNSIRKYLAYSIQVEVQKDPTPSRRKRAVDDEYLAYNIQIEGENKKVHSRYRRAVNNATSSGVNVDFQVGSQSECADPTNPDIPCNGPPVDPNQSYGYQIIAKQNGVGVQTSSINTSNPVTATTVTTVYSKFDFDKPSVFYILGLTVLGILLVVSLATLGFVLLHAHRYYHPMYLFEDMPSTLIHKFGLPPQINRNPLKRNKKQKKSSLPKKIKKIDEKGKYVSRATRFVPEGSLSRNNKTEWNVSQRPWGDGIWSGSISSKKELDYTPNPTPNEFNFNLDPDVPIHLQARPPVLGRAETGSVKESHK